MANVLGRITTSEDVPRGPDVKHRIQVKRDWLVRGEAIEVDLPRNLACAKCDGGGCDTCAGAGALSLRGRDELAEKLRVFLPGDRTARRAVALRIPEKGGLPSSEGTPRGMLILTVVAADANDESVRKVHPSLVPPGSDHPVVQIESEPSAISWPLVILVAIVAWILLLVILRAAGAF